MISIKRILLPTDFSEYADAARKYACGFADEFGSELHLLHVLEVHVNPTPELGMGLALPSHFEESQQLAEERLTKVLDHEWASERQVSYTTTHGPPFLGIIQYAQEQDIDLIVMGTHGHSGLAHLLIGSVAERVVRKAPCPVLTVRPDGHQFVMP